MAFYPGPGLGGHCIPIDPHYLAWKLRTLNYTARFIELASEVNGAMPQFVVDRVVKALNDERKAVNGSKVLVAGVAYKPNVTDVRESPAADVIALLTDLGATVTYHDPHVPEFVEGPHRMSSVELSAETLRNADCVVIVTNHKAIDYDLVRKEARLVVDTRNALKGTHGPGRVVRL